MKRIRHIEFVDPEAEPPLLFIRWEDGTEEVKEGDYPYFYVRSKQKSEWVSWPDFKPVKKIYCHTLNEVKTKRKKYDWTGEANIPYLRRYCIDHGLSYSPKRKIMYLDIEVGDAERGSIDVENTPLPVSLISIKLKGKPTVTLANQIEHPNAIYCSSEDEMFKKFAYIYFKIRPDIVAGWNIAKYDLPYLRNRFNENELFTSYRDLINLRYSQTFDLLALYKEYFESGGRASLQIVAELIGEEKLEKGDFVEYNRHDVYLCEKIDEYFGISDLLITFQELVPVHIADMHRSQIIDAYIQIKAKQRKIVLPTESPWQNDETEMVGAYVADPEPGVYENVVFYDIRSAYPSILLGLKLKHEEGEESLFLDVLKELYEIRLELKRLKKENPDDIRLALRDKAFKFLINAQTGMLGYKGMRYYNPHLYNKMTGLVREAAQLIVSKFKGRVIYADTDSACAVYDNSPDELLEEINETLRKHNLPLQYEIDKVFKKIVFLGKKKNYFGLDERGKLVYANMYAAQTSIPLIAKRILEEVMMKVLDNEPVQHIKDYLKIAKVDFMSAELAELAEWRMTKRPESYKTQSYHIRAVKNFEQMFGEKIELPSKIGLLPMKTGEWMVFNEVSARYCEENVDKAAIWKKWVAKPSEEILRFISQRMLFTF